MKESSSKLAKNSLIYAVFTLLQRGFAFFLIPLYTTQLSTEEYGLLGIVMAAIPFLVLLAGVSLRGSTAYFYYEYRDKESYLKRFWGSSFTFILLFSGLFALFLWLTNAFILQYFLKDIAFYPYLLLALISVATQPAYYYYQSILKAKQLAKKAALLDFLYFFHIVTLTLVFILGFDMKAEGALLALAISNFLFFLYSVFKTSENIEFCLDKEPLKRALKYSLPIIPHNLSAWAMNLADRLILNNLSTLSVVGLFDIGAQIGKLINIVTLGVNSAYSPWFFEQLKLDSNNKTTIANITSKIVLFYVIIAVAVSWMSPEILILITSKPFYGSWVVVPFISYAFVINGFYYCFSNVFFLEKTKYLPIITFTGAIINIVLNFILIPLYGMMGAATASIISKLIFTLIAYWQSQKLFHIPYNLFKICIYVILGFFISCLPYLLQDRIADYNIVLVIASKILVIILVLMIVFWRDRTIVLLYIRNKLRKVHETK